MAPNLIDRFPPHSPEAEQAVLACLLLSPCETVPLCQEKFRDPGVFYDLRHQAIYDTLVKMYDARQPVDLITVAQRLKDTQQLERVGGLEYLAPLPDKVPSAANAGYYIDIVWDKYLLRRMIQTCTGMIGRVYEHEGEVTELLDQFETQVLQIGQDRAQTACESLRDLVPQAIDRIEQYHQRQGALTGLATGLADLDKMTGGLQPSEFIILAARPSAGKTSLAMNIAEHVAIEQKLPVGVFSLEMSNAALVMRLLCSRARVNLRYVRAGFLAERDFPKLAGAAAKLGPAPIWFDASANLSIGQLRAKARRMVQAHGVRLIVIDYLQLMAESGRRENRQQEVAEISRGLKTLACEFDLPVLALSQLNRTPEREGRRAPRASDLRESGSLENDADLVLLLYPETTDDEEADRARECVPVNLTIAKQRNGPTGDIRLVFLKAITRFESAAHIDRADDPVHPHHND